MGELIVHIDQKSGAVLKVQQKLDREQRETLHGKKCEFSQEQIERGVVDLPALGNLYHGSSEEVLELLKHRDTFQRFVQLPVELWEKDGNTVCTIVIGGVPYRCVHRR